MVPDRIFVPTSSTVAIAHLTAALQKCDHAESVTTVRNNGGAYLQIMYADGIGGPVNVTNMTISNVQNGSELVVQSGNWTQLTLNQLRDWAINGADCSAK
jgi:hypothetical protein